MYIYIYIPRGFLYSSSLSREASQNLVGWGQKNLIKTKAGRNSCEREEERREGQRKVEMDLRADDEEMKSVPFYPPRQDLLSLSLQINQRLIKLIDRNRVAVPFLSSSSSTKYRVVDDSSSNPWCAALRTPDGHNRTPVCHSLPLISWTSCPRAVATILPRVCSTCIFVYARVRVYSYNVRPPRSIRPSFQGLMIGLDCSANIGEPQDHLLPCSPPTLAPFNVRLRLCPFILFHVSSRERKERLYCGQLIMSSFFHRTFHGSF